MLHLEEDGIQAQNKTHTQTAHPPNRTLQACLNNAIKLTSLSKNIIQMPSLRLIEEGSPSIHFIPFQRLIQETQITSSTYFPSYTHYKQRWSGTYPGSLRIMFKQSAYFQTLTITGRDHISILWPFMSCS